MRCVFALISVIQVCRGSIQTVTTGESLDDPSTCGTHVFEGVEKRFELLFHVDISDELGLRAIARNNWDSVCSAANCVIIHHEKKSEFDSYILSESSLFVFRDRVMMKTCGTTVPLASADYVVRFAASRGIHLVGLIYSRSSFLYQHLQEYPHKDDQEELEYLNTHLLPDRAPIESKTFILGNQNDRYWIVHQKVFQQEPLLTPSLHHKRVVVDCIMSGLHSEICDKFFRDESKSVPENEVEMSKYISDVLPEFRQICAKSFDKCGYSCNAHDPIKDIAGDRYFTIHITPEVAFSYASVETVFYVDEGESTIQDIKDFIVRVAKTFEPSTLSVAVVSAPGVEFTAENMEFEFDTLVQGSSHYSRDEDLVSASSPVVYSRSESSDKLGTIETGTLLCGCKGSYVTYNLVHTGITV